VIDEPCHHPDLLRRFVAAPYVFSCRDASNRLHIESNDLEIALSIWHSNTVKNEGKRVGGLFCRLVRDTTSPAGGSELSIVSDGAMRVLHIGQGTILIHDKEKSELLGFVCRNVKGEELASLLIPTLLGL
jgi:hypothetical protein